MSIMKLMSLLPSFIAGLFVPIFCQDMPFMVSSNAAETLREFCTWQHAQNDRDPNSTMHHDTAILITRSVLSFIFV